MKRFALILLALVAASGAAYAQYASTLVPIAREQRISRDQALWVAGSIAGSLPVGTRPVEAVDLLSRLLPGSIARLEPDAPVQVGVFAHLLLRLEESPTGFWYGIVPGPYTAFEQLRSTGLLDDYPASSARLSGSEAVTIARRYMAYVRALSREERP